MSDVQWAELFARIKATIAETDALIAKSQLRIDNDQNCENGR